MQILWRELGLNAKGELTAASWEKFMVQYIRCAPLMLCFDAASMQSLWVPSPTRAASMRLESMLCTPAGVHRLQLWRREA
jgi:hypothetical protein